MASKRTIKYNRLAFLFSLISLALTVAPLLGAIIASYADINISVGKKVTLTTLVVGAVILTVFNVLMKWNLRSIPYIVIIGIHICLGNILTLLIVFCICVIIDEIIVTPLAKKFKRRAEINREFDAREKEWKKNSNTTTQTT